MAFYRDRVLPHLVEWACANEGMRRWRDEVTAELDGRVVEIGFGSGTNVEHYPDRVEIVFGIEPSLVARRMAAERIARSRVPVELVGLDGEALPLEDASCDSALSTFTLCTIPDAGRALAELHRVLRPGGRLWVLEHGLADDESVARWQRRLDPLQVRFAGGCHLTRDAAEMVGAAGFEVSVLSRRYARGPKPWSFFTTAVAVKDG